VSWKKAAADLSEKSAADKDALEAQIRELKVKLLVAQGPAARPAVPAPPAPPPPEIRALPRTTATQKA